ncbi:ABC transporter ATP-binding protein [Acetivibrio ethanolgignens]|uniref:ABC transporter domain-containing protein n=1 Tax=Acetivibrio ethanolgignens TaxID=290052 RepID=A0A0V8QJN3_9FIRM|nr:ABC transporter ATP-binding protein [Acetivibrio ethanolgignens]KSV60732.1 hypothetical protein ASU35_00760 [Acetivibrio ethanolgignens]
MKNLNKCNLYNGIRKYRCLWSVIERKSRFIFGGQIIVNIFLTAYSIVLPAFVVISFERCENKQKIWMIYIILILLARIALEYINSFLGQLSQNECKYVNWKLEMKLSKKFVDVDYLKTEDPDFLDLKTGASFSIINYNTIENLIKGLILLISQSIVLIWSGFFLLTSYPILLLFVIGSFLLQIIINSKMNGKLCIYFEKLFPINRRFNWINSTKYDLERQKDVRLNGMEGVLERKMKAYNQETYSLFHKMNATTLSYNCLVDIESTILLFCAFSYLIFNVAFNNMHIGLCMTLINLLLNITSTLSGIGDSITSNLQMINYMNPIIQILNCEDIYKSRDNSVKIETIDSIKFSNVSFSYPNSEKLILDNVSFEIKKGQKVGIIGMNGAGKTTIIKLICGLILPTSGEIYINNMNIDCIDRASYFKLIAAIFQDFYLYDFSISENIICANDINVDRIRKVVEFADLEEFIMSLDYGMNTMIGARTNEQGINLSGGEQQKIVLARGLYKDGQLYALDEPNSNLDPIAEDKIYQRYERIGDEKMVVFVSHKISSTKFCDDIIIIENGKLLERGKPEELLANKNTRYYKLSQMEI